MEVAIISGVNYKFFRDKNFSQDVEFFLNGDFQKVLKGNVAQQILLINHANNCALDVCIYQNVEQYLISDTTDRSSREKELEVLVIGASCLQLFVQNNWVGPHTDSPPALFCPDDFTDNDIQQTAFSSLSEYEEPVYTLTRFPGFLYIAKIIFVDCHSLVKFSQTWDWWMVRLFVIWQSLLENKSSILKDTIMQTLNDISQSEFLLQEENRQVAALFHIEAVRMCEMHWQHRLAQEHMKQALDLTGITVELSGALGKKTRFQVEHKAQLVVKVSHVKESGSSPDISLPIVQNVTSVPKVFVLDDDTVLDRIEFKDDCHSAVCLLSPLEQAVVLSLAETYRHSVAEEKLTDEEVLAYLDHILQQSLSWSVSVASMALRCKIECHNRCHVDRCLRQLENLVSQTKQSNPPVSDRLFLFYAARPPTSWLLQGHLAEVFVSLGCIGHAIDIYQKLELWEDVIRSYTHMGKLNKAESVIRDQLSLKETPSLLCFLGDVTNEKTHYEHAWELSNHRSSRAMRCLGFNYFSEQKAGEAVDCFEKSLAINSLQLPVWFTCGCANMAAGNYSAAAKDFKRCLTIDCDNFEAWANLASAYGRLGEKRKAFMTVKDAIKCNYENWKLWENCLVFAVDYGEFEEAIRAYHRLLDLKTQYCDFEVLNILSKAVSQNIQDANNYPSQLLISKLLQLFGRLRSQMTLNAETWRLYADLCRFEAPSHKPDMEKALECLYKVLQHLKHKCNWEKDVQQCKKVADVCLEISEVSQACSDAEASTDKQATQMLSCAKFSLHGVLTSIKKSHSDAVTGIIPEPVKVMCCKLSTAMDTITLKEQQFHDA